MSARVGLIGPRRVRQGLGPFVARDLHAAGAQVTSVLSTRTESLEQAQRELGEVLGREPRGYTDLDQLLASESLDALVILSPAETHERFLVAAARSGLHVLCEKPLVWGGGDPLARARTCVGAFREKGLLIAENCQWPWTLPAFRELHPGLPAAAPGSFRMRLSPDSSGLQALGDCLPHPLSLLQTLAPGPEPKAHGVRFSVLPGEPPGLGVRFEYRAGGARVEVELELRTNPEPPRAASLEIDGRRAERRIRMPDYEISFHDAGREVPVPDPLGGRVHAFVRALDAVLAGGRPPDPAALSQRIALIETIVEAFRAGSPPIG